MPAYYFWQLLSGIALFLLGMDFIAKALHTVAGRPFKLFLKRQTSNTLKAITGGALVTGILQSSSVVNTMVLAFVGARVLTLPNALAVILGDNLGTTVDSWFFATAGFKLNLGNLGFALTGIAGITTLVFNKNNRWHSWSHFLFGVGFLFLGLDFMKAAMMNVAVKIDLRSFSEHGAFYFFLVGLLITSLIQSSSATIAILLSALYAHTVTLYSACAVVLGAEIGTTLKFILATVHAGAAQKRVAFGNLLFNVIVSILALLLLSPILFLITGIIGIKDELIGLVFFQSFINLAGIILFYPLLGLFARLLEKFFTHKAAQTTFINKVMPANIDLAIHAFENETQYFLYYVIDYCQSIFGNHTGINKKIILSPLFAGHSPEAKYEFIKQLHGKLLAYYIELQNASSGKEDIVRSNQLMGAVRNSMYAAKSMKDGTHDAEMLRNSSNDMKYNFYLDTVKTATGFYSKAAALLQEEHHGNAFKQLEDILKEVQDGYSKTVESLYKKRFINNLTDIEISSIINFNRQVYTSFKSILLAVKDRVLDEKEAEYFDALPGFIH